MKFEAPRRLTAEDDASAFSCGTQAIDAWLWKHARHAAKRGTAVVYVSCDERGKIAGFYALSAHSMDRSVLTGWLARNATDQIPVILLDMLGVRSDCSGAELETQLLLDACHRAQTAAQTIGARALVVDPLDEDAAAFYLNHGFEHVPGSNRLFARF